MLFQTPEFLLFITAVLLLYWVVLKKSHRGQNLMLLGASYLFYGWWDWRFLGLIFFSTLIDYFCGLSLDERNDDDNGTYKYDAIVRKRILLVSLVCNLGF